VAAAFDTLRYVTRPRTGGFPEAQAIALGEALSDAVGETLATKDDLRGLEERMDRRFAAVDQRFALLEQHLDQRFALLAPRFAAIDRRFTEMEYRLTVRLGSMLAVAAGVVAALARLF